MDIEVEHFNLNTVLKHFKGLQSSSVLPSICHVIFTHPLSRIIMSVKSQGAQNLQKYPNCALQPNTPIMPKILRFAHKYLNCPRVPKLPKWVGIAQSAPKRPIRA